MDLIPSRPLRTHKEIAALIGISHQRFWQIEQKALRKLRRRLAAVPEVREYFAGTAHPIDQETSPCR